MMKQKKGSKQIVSAKENLKLSQGGLSQRQALGTKAVIWSCKNITIHHECPCSIEISHPWGQNLTRDRLMMDHFFPTFSKGFCWNITLSKDVKIITFYLFDLHYF